VIRNALKLVPDEIKSKSKYNGCGSPLPLGVDGLTILDLGSGSGQDCYVAAQLVGESGSVIGIDMTDGQLAIARKYTNEFCQETLGYTSNNLQFIKGYIEMLPDYVPLASIDLVISNCVVNLSPRKDQVLQGVYQVLREGGEFYFSDVYCDRRLSQDIRCHPVLVGECLGGALYTEDFRRICQDVGFRDPRMLSCDEIEDKCEDYGQIAIYNGSIPGHPNFYDLDDHHRFVTNKPMLVCGNTANMVSGVASWLKPYFTVIGDTKGEHFGLFDCGPISSSGNAVAGACC
jgi:ubiquinone/menaquinone biosynthesis C-methylase UbiE